MVKATCVIGQWLCENVVDWLTAWQWFEDRIDKFFSESLPCTCRTIILCTLTSKLHSSTLSPAFYYLTLTDLHARPGLLSHTRAIMRMKSTFLILRTSRMPNNVYIYIQYIIGIYIYAYAHIAYLKSDIYIYIRIYIYTYTCIYIYRYTLHIYTYTHINIYTYIHIMYTYIHIYIYTCTHIYIYTLRNLWGYVIPTPISGEPCPKLPCQLLFLFDLKMPLPPSLGHADIVIGWIEWFNVALQVTCHDVTWVGNAVETFTLVKNKQIT